MTRIVLVLGLIAFLLTPSSGGASVPLPTLPDWESTPNGQYGTGLGVGDLDHDGWVDLVVANGNDMARQRVVVYRNQGNGTYAASPTWTSGDIDYHGHLDLADVDGDGNLDCAVAVYLGAAGFGAKGRVKLYKGNGDGTFSSLPVWQSSDSFYCFSLAFGDMDMDGRPDLACATGDDYNDNPERRRIYRNIGGALETSPSWLSSEIEYSLDVIWADFNGDGALDLAFAGTSCPNRIYFSQGGSIQITAGWSSTDASIYANTVAAGDVNRDGWLDLAIADNNQLGGSGRFKIYANPGATAPTTTPFWQSNQSGYGSHVSFIDINEDGYLDLATGSWWGPVRIYENRNGTIDPEPAYTSATGSVIENEVWEDVDNDGLQQGVGAAFPATPGRKLFYLPQKPVRKILTLIVDGVAVDPGTAYLDSDDGWFVLPSLPAVGAKVYVSYSTSADIDLAVSNWDTAEGEYLFRNSRNPLEVASLDDPSPAGLRIGPNPSDGPIRIWFVGDSPSGADAWEIVDLAGRRVRAWHVSGREAVWDGCDQSGSAVPAGVYWVRMLRVDGRASIAKVIRR
jgi:hypothetical protein